MPKPETGAAIITKQHTRRPAIILVYFFNLSLAAVNNTMLIMIKAMSNSVKNAGQTQSLPGTVAT